MKRNKGLIIFLTIISFIVSLAISGYAAYLSFLENWWFILIAVYFFFEAIFILVATTRKDEYISMKVFGIFEIIGVLVMMDYLLVMILWNDSGTMVYLNSYIVFGGAAFLKGLTTIISASANRKEYNPTLHGFRNNDLITFTYLLLIIELVVFKNIYPRTSYTDTLWVYIVEVLTNASLTVLAAFLALSTAIRSKVKEDLSPIGKIKHTINWFVDNEISVYFGTIFSGYLAFLALLNAKKSWVYVFLAAFYIFIALIRLVNFIWHRSIKKKADGNKILENRKSSFILLFDSIIFFLYTPVVIAAAIMLMGEKINVDTNIYLFLFLIVPFAIMRFINAHRDLKKSRTEGDTYRIASGYLSLITAVFSMLEIVAIACHTFNKGAKLTIIIILSIFIQIFVWVICITFLVFFGRGVFQNRRSIERAYLKDKNNK